MQKEKKNKNKMQTYKENIYYEFFLLQQLINVYLPFMRVSLMF